MTLLDLLDDALADPQRHGQWRLTQLEMVNWGTFSGHVTIDVARKGHLFTGASGSALGRASCRERV